LTRAFVKPIKKKRKNVVNMNLRPNSVPFLGLRTRASIAFFSDSFYSVNNIDFIKSAAHYAALSKIRATSYAASCIEVKANGLVTDDSDFDVVKEVKRIPLA